MFDVLSNLAANMPNLVCTALINVGDVDFSDLTDTVAAIVPAIIPVVVSMAGIRKAISFLGGCIRGC